jgi:hypothetical protein
MLFLSEKTLHTVDRMMWMLPFATNTDLNESGYCPQVKTRIPPEAIG